MCAFNGTFVPTQPHQGGHRVDPHVPPAEDVVAALRSDAQGGVIASDKTGTRTRNEMTVRAVITASGCSGRGADPIARHKLGPHFVLSVEVWRDLSGLNRDLLRGDKHELGHCLTPR